MTHQEKLKALRAYLKATYDVNCCDATLEMFLPDYTFENGQIQPISSEQVTEPEEEIPLTVPDFDEPSEIYLPDHLGVNEHKDHSSEHLKDKRSVDFKLDSQSHNHDIAQPIAIVDDQQLTSNLVASQVTQNINDNFEKDKILSLDHFLRQNPKFTILKNRYFPDKRKWLIFGYDDNNCEQYNALTLSGKDTHNLAFGTYRRCLNTYLAIEPDLAYIRQREPVKLPDLSQYYGTYYTRKQLTLAGV